jgi:hypothetical protein
MLLGTPVQGRRFPQGEAGRERDATAGNAGAQPNRKAARDRDTKRSRHYNKSPHSHRGAYSDKRHTYFD